MDSEINELAITILQGATWAKRIELQTDPGNVLVDLTGFTARMQVRSSYGADHPAIISLTEALSSQGQITLGGVAGTIDIVINAAHTDTLEAGSYVYDLEIATGTYVSRVLQGIAVVNPQVTI